MPGSAKKLRIVEGIGAMQALATDARTRKQKIGFVPTMGALHAGHRTLIRHARKENDLVVVSIFVNPLQFGPGEDLETYPRDLEGDKKMILEAGGDILFYLTADRFYPGGFSTYIVPEGIAAKLEGARRPGHFRGVATVVMKLLQIIRPHYVYLGNKDAQQLAVIGRMVIDLHLPVSIVACPTVREADGLAMSSRNAYLAADERIQALALVNCLRAADELFVAGERRAEILIQAAREILDQASGLDLDYLALVDPVGWEDLTGEIDAARLLVAARVGRTRLIDNHELGQLFWRGNLLP